MINNRREAGQIDLSIVGGGGVAVTGGGAAVMGGVAGVCGGGDW